MAKWDIRPGKILMDLYDNDFSAILRDISLTGLRGCVLKTPVDTGRLRGGWIVTVNRTTGKADAGLDPTGSATIAKGAGAVQSARFGDVVTIQNNVEYAIFINDGTDRIAPRRMVERTADELGRQFR